MEISKADNTFYAEIRELLQKARNSAYQAVNVVMVQTYWQIGKRIVEQEQHGQNRANYGDFLITNLSRYLSDTFGKGFSEANLWNFRKFYLTFPEFSTRRVENLSWSHLRLIMRLDNQQEREYYILEAGNQSWSVAHLSRNIKTGYYRRLLSTQQQNNASEIQILEKYNPADFIKDPFIAEFLDIPEDLKGKETVLETALISNLQNFLLELGKGFSFVSRQMRISTETSHFYVDLVFYNYLLKCFVVIDLKTTKLTHADIGQIDMYVRMFDALKRGEDDNPTIGIILCAEKDETIVKYSVLKENKQIFASKYKTVLPTEEELATMIVQEKQKIIDKT